MLTLTTALRRSLLLSFLVITISAPSAQLRVSGANTWGQLGNKETAWSSNLRLIAENVENVEAGADHILYTDRDQSLWGLGTSAAGQLGVDLFAEGRYHTTTPKLLAKSVTQFHAGDYWSFYSDTQGTLLAAGGARQDSIGYWDGISDRDSFRSVFGFQDISKVATYFLQGLFLAESGELYGTGYAFSVGYKDGPNADEPHYIANEVIDIGTGGYKSYYLTTDLTLYDVTRYPYPASIAENVSNFSHGGEALFTVIEGDLYVQGNSQTGALGLGIDVTNVSSNALVAEGVTRVVASSQNAYFQKADGSLWGMGSNQYGQLATGDFAPRFSPVLINQDVIDFAANNTNLFAVTSQNQLLTSGKEGYATGREPIYPSMVPLHVMNDVRNSTVGFDTIFIIKEDDSLWVMGKNDRGELGTGTQVHIAEPTKTLSNVKSVSANINHTVFVLNDGTLLGSGSNENGALSFQDSITSVPQTIDTDVTAAIAATKATLYIKSDGTLWRLGDPNISSTDPSSYETDTAKAIVATDVLSVSGDSSTFYITTDKKLYATGTSTLSQYNRASSEKIAAGPLLIDENVTQISAKSGAVAYIKEDGSLWIFGNAYFLDPTEKGTTFRDSPEQIDTDVSMVKRNSSSLIYLKTDQTFWKVGYSSLIDTASSIDEIKKPHQIWAGAPIDSFDYSGNNIVYLTGPIDAPTDAAIELSSPQPVPIGESIEIRGIANGNFLNFKWYKGTAGDRSQPIQTLGRNKFTIHPYVDSDYWLEVENEMGTASPPESITVKSAYPAYGEWASSNGFFYPHGLIDSDEDGDSLSNLMEFAFGLDPLKFDSQPISLSIDSETDSLKINYPKIAHQDLRLGLVGLDESQGAWQPFTDFSTETENDTSQITIPFASLEERTLLKLQIQPPE